ncbi:MAG: CRISPR-associated endonuclease Cas2 [Bacteroidota bacterium]|nr:CRISPR-associated endonuclease Cas2 [Bacteroidota bacterium]
MMIAKKSKIKTETSRWQQMMLFDEHINEINYLFTPIHISPPLDEYLNTHNQYSTRVKIICMYDITKTKIRNYTINRCKKAGMYRLQKSVFIGEIKESSRDDLLSYFNALKSQLTPTDSIIILPITESSITSLKQYGTQKDLDHLLLKTSVYFI